MTRWPEMPADVAPVPGRLKGETMDKTEIEALVARLEKRAAEDRAIQTNNETIAEALKGQRMLFDEGFRSPSNTFAVRLQLDYENCAKRDASLAADWEAAASAMTALKAERDAAVARAESPEQALADKILAELVRARTKFPGKNVTFAALVEEVGELATATFEESAERVEKEAVQVAVMAMRMVLDGDHCFDGWRKEKGLDALDPAARAALPEAKGEK